MCDTCLSLCVVCEYSVSMTIHSSAQVKYFPGQSHSIQSHLYPTLTRLKHCPSCHPAILPPSHPTPLPLARLSQFITRMRSAGEMTFKRVKTRLLLCLTFLHWKNIATECAGGRMMTPHDLITYLNQGSIRPDFSSPRRVCGMCAINESSPIHQSTTLDQNKHLSKQ